MPLIKLFIFSILKALFICTIATKMISRRGEKRKDCGPYCPLDCAPLCTPVCCDISSYSFSTFTSNNTLDCNAICQIDISVVESLAKDLVETYECSPQCNQNTTCCTNLKSAQLARLNSLTHTESEKSIDQPSKHYLSTPYVSESEPRPSCPFDCLPSCYPACTTACCNLDINAIYSISYRDTSKLDAKNQHQYSNNKFGTDANTLQLYPKKGQCSFDCSPSCFPKCSPACCSK